MQPAADGVSLVTLLQFCVFFCRAFYTVAHILQNGTLNGREPTPSGIRPEQMTDEVGAAHRRWPQCTLAIAHIFFILLRSHSINFTRAQGIPKDKIGFDMSLLFRAAVCVKVWSHIFLDGPAPSSSDIPAALLGDMKRVHALMYSLIALAQCPEGEKLYRHENSVGCSSRSCGMVFCRNSTFGTPWTSGCLER